MVKQQDVGHRRHEWTGSGRRVRVPDAQLEIVLRRGAGRDSRDVGLLVELRTQRGHSCSLWWGVGWGQVGVSGWTAATSLFHFPGIYRKQVNKHTYFFKSIVFDFDSFHPEF